jgi:hypothetical protein
LLVLRGLTGVGKTRLLKMLQKEGYPVVDLEGIANHRGSAFGNLGLAPQPSQISFEALLWDEMRRIPEGGYALAEGESKHIGRLILPARVYAALQVETSLWIEAPIETRVRITLDDYPARDELKRDFLRPLALIRPRLGGENHDRLLGYLEAGRWEDLTPFQMVQRNSRGKLFLARLLRKAHKTVVEHTNITKIRAGGWYGNDTIWRPVLDLNKILLYADREGVMRPERQRKFFSVVDGIVGGEGDGPVLPTPKPCGALLAGFNPLAVDLCATRLMGFDYRLFAQFEMGLKLRKYPIMPFDIHSIRCLSNVSEWCDILNKTGSMLQFKPASGWEGRIEVDATRDGQARAV